VKRSIVAGATLALILGTSVAARSAQTQPQPESTAASHGSQVMPFDQKTAMHMFTPSGSGGSVEVMVHNMDANQIFLVRSHLRAEADRFSKGNYADPAYIHGPNMPGLASLEANPQLVSVTYADTTSGGVITLTSKDPKMIDAIHQWLGAQQKDHGSMNMDM
jgi:hypothetical protein